MNHIELGTRIKQCRKSKKMTQEKLAESINVSPHYIYEIEKGIKSMSLPILADIATTLNVSTDYLLFGTHNTENIPLDNLNLIIQTLSPQKRDNLADILTTLLPYLK